MHPVPLTDPTGTVRAYACGRCGHVSNPSSPWGVPDDVAAANLRQAEITHREADWCCRCRECGVDLPNGRRIGHCATCEEALLVERKAAAQAYQARECRRIEASDAAIVATGGDCGAAYELRKVMRELNEELWSAGWLHGSEHTLWRELVCPPGEARELDARDIDNLRNLSTRARGWWRWDDDAGGEVFVSMPEWERLYAEHASAVG